MSVPQCYLKKQHFFGLTFWPNVIQTNKKKSSWLPLLRGTSDHVLRRTFSEQCKFVIGMNEFWFTKHFVCFLNQKGFADPN